MDKKETTRLLNNLLEYNKVDINNIRATFPDLGNAFMNVVLAIDEEYGSGNIDRTLLRETKKRNFNEFGDSFIGKYLYKPNSKEWYYFDSITNYDEANQRYTFKIYTNNAFSKSNVAEENIWPVKSLEEIVSTKEVEGWKLFTLNVGDKVALPKTKQGIAGYTSGTLREARLRGQNYLYIVEIQKNGTIVLWYDNIPSNGDFFIMQDVEPYEENEEKLGFKVGDYYTSETWIKGAWVKITDITQDQVNGFDEKGKPYLNYISLLDQELASGYFKIIPDPTKKITFKVGDYFTGKNFSTDVKWIKITEILKDKILGIRDDNTLYDLNINRFNENIDSGEFYIIPDPIVVQTKKVDFKEGDRFYVQYSPKELYTIKKINQNDIIIGYTDVAGKYKENARRIKDAQENFDNGAWILSGKSTTPVTSQYSFKVGDSFIDGNDTYTIDNISQQTDSSGVTKDVISYKFGPGNKLKNSMWAVDFEEEIKDGTYTLVSASTSSVNYVTQWTPEWKARKLRPSPTRKASLENVDALGLGNDGLIYKVEEDKRGVKKWKKTRYSVFNSANRTDFTSRYDLELLYDQLTYENSQLDKNDIEYKENDRLIKLIIKDLQ